MHVLIMAGDNELWDVILDGSHAPMKSVKVEKVTTFVPKTNKEYDKDNRKKIEKRYRTKRWLVYKRGLNEYNRISASESAKEI